MRMSQQKIKGVVTVEFGMGFMLFWWICMAWVEMSYMSYVSAISDMAVSEASRIARLEDEQPTECTKNEQDETVCVRSYKERFSQALRNNDSLWAKLVDPQKFTFSINYIDDLQSLKDLPNDYCALTGSETENECGTAEDSSIAIYRVNYRYSPIFNYFFSSEQYFSREVIVIQEYERDQFNF